MSLDEIDWIDGNGWDIIYLICINFLVDSLMWKQLLNV